MTIGQSLLGAILLSNMRFAWWEAGLLFFLWAVQFVLSGFEKPLDVEAHNSLAQRLAGGLSTDVRNIESIAHLGKAVITYIYFVWVAVVLAMGIKRRSLFKVFKVFSKLMRDHW
jgi:hypothetical protein